MTEDQAIAAVKAALTPIELQIFLQRVSIARMTGAHVADILSILNDTDAYVGEVEDAIDARPQCPAVLVATAVRALIWIFGSIPGSRLDEMLKTDPLDDAIDANGGRFTL